MARHGLTTVDKLNWNEGLWGPLPGVLDAVAGALDQSWAYPEHAYNTLREAIAAETGARPAQVLPGHGIQALILTARQRVRRAPATRSSCPRRPTACTRRRAASRARA